MNYGKLYFYNHIKLPKVDVSTSYAAFTVASTLGSSEAQYYLSLMHFYNLDNFKEKDLLDTTRVDKYWEASQYIKTRNERLSFLYLYSSSMNGDERVVSAMANKYMKVNYD